MIKKYLLFLCLIIAELISNASAQERELLYSVSLTDKLRNIATKIQDINQAKVPYAELTENNDYFARIIPRQYILTESNEVQEDAVLGAKPFVFFTTPEGIYGKSLLEIYLEIGYKAENIIKWQRNQEMIVIVFRYPKNIILSKIKNGHLPKVWDQNIYVPTWNNVFSIFHRLTKNGTIKPNKPGGSEFAPEKLFFNDEAQKVFILNFPETEKIKSTPYPNLKLEGGKNWDYRELLERKLSIFEHFQGNGRTLNGINSANIKTENGLFEFIGPNMKINDFPEFAIIDLGMLIIKDTYTLEND